MLRGWPHIINKYLATNQSARLRKLEMWFKRDDKEKREHWVQNINQVRCDVEDLYNRGHLDNDRNMVCKYFLYNIFLYKMDHRILSNFFIFVMCCLIVPFQTSVAKYYEKRKLFPEVEYSGFTLDDANSKTQDSEKNSSQIRQINKLIEREHYHLRLHEKNDNHPAPEFQFLGLGYKT